MQKILISGYTGFIGTNLTSHLSHELLYGVDIVQKDSVAKHFAWETLEECKDCDCIIHLAGKAHGTIKKGAFRPKQRQAEGRYPLNE
jgi:nucleoside-diphosphate-sugar epimerase